jgi:hypothetical protein
MLGGGGARARLMGEGGGLSLLHLNTNSHTHDTHTLVHKLAPNNSAAHATRITLMLSLPLQRKSNQIMGWGLGFVGGGGGGGG